MVLKRFPDGVGGPMFFQQNAGGHVPGVVRIEKITRTTHPFASRHSFPAPPRRSVPGWPRRFRTETFSVRSVPARVMRIGDIRDEALERAPTPRTIIQAIEALEGILGTAPDDQLARTRQRSRREVAVQEAQEAGAQQSERDVAVSQEVYSREMPGGGRVLVELLVSDRGDVAGERSRGRVVVDGTRGRAARGSAIIVVEELEDADSSAVVDKLFQIARDNVAIARRLIRRSAGA